MVRRYPDAHPFRNLPSQRNLIKVSSRSGSFTRKLLAFLSPESFDADVEVVLRRFSNPAYGNFFLLRGSQSGKAIKMLDKR